MNKIKSTNCPCHASVITQLSLHLFLQSPNILNSIPLETVAKQLPLRSDRDSGCWDVSFKELRFNVVVIYSFDNNFATGGGMADVAILCHVELSKNNNARKLQKPLAHCIIRIVATSPVALRWLCDSPRTGCAWRITPLYMWREQAIIVIMACELYSCLLSQCEALRTCRSGFPIATESIATIIGASPRFFWGGQNAWF